MVVISILCRIIWKRGSFPLDSVDLDYANLEEINAIFNSIHRSTKNWLVFGINGPRNLAPPHLFWWRHSFCGVSRFSNEPVDLSPTICQVSHLKNVYVVSVKISQWKTDLHTELGLGRPLDHDIQYRSKLDLHQEVGDWPWWVKGGIQEVNLGFLYSLL